jgi:hypothetical protein
MNVDSKWVEEDGSISGSDFEALMDSLGRSEYWKGELEKEKARSLQASQATGALCSMMTLKMRELERSRAILWLAANVAFPMNKISSRLVAGPGMSPWVTHDEMMLYPYAVTAGHPHQHPALLLFHFQDLDLIAHLENRTVPLMTRVPKVVINYTAILNLWGQVKVIAEP